VPIALALMLFYTYPAGVALADILLGRERATPIRLGALAVSTGGVVLVLAGGLAGNASPISPLGILLGLTASACQVVFVTTSRTNYRSVPAAAATLVILVTASVGAIALALVVGQADGLTAPFRDARAWVPVLLAGIAGAAMASMLFLTAIRRIGGTRTGALMLLEPVVGVFLAAVLLGEALSPIQALGAALVLGGALTLQRASDPGLDPVVETAAGPLA
jgi:drug/metabolite transporter (DMT)-like permease